MPQTIMPNRAKKEAPVTKSGKDPELEQAPVPLLGLDIAGYLLVETLGATDSAGQVYKAQDPDSGTIVAIKEYAPPAAYRSPEGRVMAQSGHEADYAFGLRLFRQEAETIASLDDPALMQIHDIVEANGTCYVIMPFLGSETLMHRIEAPGQPPEDEVRALLMPLMSGLQKLHDAGMIHANLAPEHISLIARRPVLIGHAMTSLALRNRIAGPISERVGRLPYLPLEIICQSEPADPASDIYGLASIIAHWLTGAEPTLALFRLRETAPVPLTSSLRHAYSRSLLRFLDAGMEPLIEDRPPSMEYWGRLLLDS